MTDKLTAAQSEREAMYPDLCNKLTRGIWAATTFCGRPKRHAGDCEWQLTPGGTGCQREPFTRAAGNGPGRDGEPSRDSNDRSTAVSHFLRYDLQRNFNGKCPPIVCLCGSTRFYDEFQRANYERTMAGEIVLSVGFYPHARAEHGHGEGVGHDSTEKVTLDELHKRKIDLADYVLVISDPAGYFGESTRSEIEYAVMHGKPVEFANLAAKQRAYELELV